MNRVCENLFTSKTADGVVFRKHDLFNKNPRRLQVARFIIDARKAAKRSE